MHRLSYLLGCLVLLSGELWAAPGMVDLSDGVVLVSAGERGQAEKMAATILVEEIAKRTGIELVVQSKAPQGGQSAITIRANKKYNVEIKRGSEASGKNYWSTQPEGYAIRVVPSRDSDAGRVTVLGADSRGAMFGVGRLLRELHLSKGKILLKKSFLATAAPEYPARGHEMGYRARANSYDAWSREQFDQYIREQVIFGMNCVQGIPFQDERTNDLMQYSREEMNRMLGEICARYDLDYWVWTPVEFTLTDEELRKAELARHEAFYRSTPRLDAVFVPGGDPGDNPPELVLPFMEDLARLLTNTHPKAKVWVSLQDF